jgi:hypothetical protein
MKSIRGRETTLLQAKLRGWILRRLWGTPSPTYTYTINNLIFQKGNGPLKQR